MTEIKNLIKGYKYFYDQSFKKKKETFNKLSLGQNPKTLVVACSDSRVDPAVLTNSQLGDIFVVRNIANIIPKHSDKSENNSTIAAIEFGILVLKITNIIVLGHSGCAGVKAIIENKLPNNLNNVKEWIHINSKLKDFVKEDVEKDFCFFEKENIKISMNNLLSFSWVKEKVKKKELFLKGWYFSIHNCSLEEYDNKENKFTRVKI